MSLETKDSGQRLTFESGMVRDVSADKTYYDLPFYGPMFDRWAELLTRGAKKYDRNNWMKAAGEAELERFKESAARHFRQWMRGDTDEDHAAAVYFNLNGAEYVLAKLAPAAVERRVDNLPATVTLTRPTTGLRKVILADNGCSWHTYCGGCDDIWADATDDEKKKELA